MTIGQPPECYLGGCEVAKKKAKKAVKKVAKKKVAKKAEKKVAKKK